MHQTPSVIPRLKTLCRHLVFALLLPALFFLLPAPSHALTVETFPLPIARPSGAKRCRCVASGSLFENAAFLALRKLGEVSYYMKKSGVEIDFILDGKSAFEIKQKAETKDLSNLKKRSADISIPENHIVSRRFCGVDGVMYGYQL